MGFGFGLASPNPIPSDGACARRLEDERAQKRHPLLPPHGLELLEERQEVDLRGEGGQLRPVAARARRAARGGVGARCVQEVLDHVAHLVRVRVRVRVSLPLPLTLALTLTNGAHERGGGRALDLLEPLAARAAHDDAHARYVEVVDGGGDAAEEGRVDVAQLGARHVAEPDLVVSLGEELVGGTDARAVGRVDLDLVRVRVKG